MQNNYLIKFVATCGFIGKIRLAPGTFGSLLAFPIAYLVAYYGLSHPINFKSSNLTLGESRILSLIAYELTVLIFLFIIGIYCSSKHAKNLGLDDPKEIVIDEVVGQMLTIILTFFSISFLQFSSINNYLPRHLIDIIFAGLLPFILFRFFDIFKPWPICWLDQNIKGGLGIMLDDIAASIFASTVHYIIILNLIK